MASASYDNTIKLFQEDDGDWENINTLEGHDSTVWSISWSKDGNRLVSGSDDKTIRIWRRFRPGNMDGNNKLVFDNKVFTDPKSSNAR